ncbi:periplasmic protein TonB [Sphingomonas sp. F9_3S_D5_B_2]
MTSYSGNVNRPERARAIAAVVTIHCVLAAVILSGLNVDKVRQAVEKLKTFDIREIPPPPLPPPPQQARTAKEAAGAPAPRAQASPVVAPRPKIPVRTPVPAARSAGQGSASSSGASTAGGGTGAGRTGVGTGGGGTDYSGFTPARLIRNIPSSQYRELAAAGMPSGEVAVTIRVATDGSVSNCRIARSSGDATTDSLVCLLTDRYVRFTPARDPDGRAVSQDITYFPNWRRR